MPSFRAPDTDGINAYHIYTYREAKVGSTGDNMHTFTILPFLQGHLCSFLTVRHCRHAQGFDGVPQDDIVSDAMPTARGHHFYAKKNGITRHFTWTFLFFRMLIDFSPALSPTLPTNMARRKNEHEFFTKFSWTEIVSSTARPEILD